MRLVNGGRIDRSRLLRFSFDGRELTGHPGDTVASALLAAGQVEVAPSLYRGRPRGIFTADCTEPNALVAPRHPNYQARPGCAVANSTPSL